MSEQSFIAELRKRKVVQAAAIYGAVAWGVTEIVVTVVQQLYLPQWVSTLAVIFFVVGFPVAMFLSWTFDLTASGVQRTAIASRRGTTSIAFSMLLLVAGTAGLFFVIKPEMEHRDATTGIVSLAPHSVAVLPFDYAGLNPDDSYLGSGLSDELRDQLARVKGLQIAARSSSIAAIQNGADAKLMAQQLGVATLLEGNMRRQGNMLRVSVQLIDGASGLALWSDTFDRDRRELVNVQQDIAAAVVRNVLPDSSEALAEPTTQNSTAKELMLLGRYYEQQVRSRQDVDIETLQRAVHYYRKAAEADPESALAKSRLAGALLFLGDLDGAEAYASAALLLDPNLAEVQYTFGKILFARGSPNMGEPLARAVELNPNLPDALADYAYWYWYNRGTDGVRELYQRALELDPLNVSRYAALGTFLALNDRPDEARTLVRQMQDRFDGATAYRAIADVLDLIGDVDQSIAWTIKARDEEPDDRLHVQKLAEYYADIGDYTTAAELEPDLGVGLLFKMRRYEDMIDKAELQMIDYPEDIQLRVYLGFAYSATGEFDAAIRTISSSGLLETFAHTRRGSAETDGFAVLVDAAYGSGEVDKARELAAWQLDTHYEAVTGDWWVALRHACSSAILGQDDKVQRLFLRSQETNRLAWEPMLRDQYCFKRFADDPAYQALVQHFDDRRALLRARLPSTLARFGVSL